METFVDLVIPLQSFAKEVNREELFASQGLKILPRLYTLLRSIICNYFH